MANILGLYLNLTVGPVFGLSSQTTAKTGPSPPCLRSTKLTELDLVCPWEGITRKSQSYKLDWKVKKKPNPPWDDNGHQFFIVVEKTTWSPSPRKSHAQLKWAFRDSPMALEIGLETQGAVKSVASNGQPLPTRLVRGDRTLGFQK